MDGSGVQLPAGIDGPDVGLLVFFYWYWELFHRYAGQESTALVNRMMMLLCDGGLNSMGRLDRRLASEFYLRPDGLIEPVRI